MNNKNTSWGKVAGWYNQLLEEGQDTYQEKLIKPNLLRILDPKAREEILDVGCGQGFFSRIIAQTGANVLGIDVSQELIKYATNEAKAKKSDRENYLVLSAEKMTGLADKRFSAAICILALQNMKDMPAAISEISRVLKSNGRVVLVLNHPTFRITGASEWSYDEKKNIQYRNISKYLSEITQEVDMTQGVKDESKKKFTYSFHHPLQVFFKAFSKAGLVVIRLEEWSSHKTSDKGPRKAAEDKSRKEIPLFMCLELKKL
jgi:ubiquinone/menaquinone biosynthesis C-methylase UbiE